MSLYKNIVRPFLFQLPPEQAHDVVCTGLAVSEAVRFFQLIVGELYEPYDDDTLVQTFFGQTFKHPVGLAAGFDKNALYPNTLECLGFGSLEFGSLSFKPSEGNLLPRLFRLPEDNALINRMGLNNDGIQARLDDLMHIDLDSPWGINITKTPGLSDQEAIDDFTQAYLFANKLPTTYIALNISCPNTADGKSFESPDSLEALLMAFREALPQPEKPILIKLSSDCQTSICSELLAIGERYKIAGWIIGNTSKNRDLLHHTSKETLASIGDGGLSGEPIQALSTRLLAHAYTATRSWRKPPVLIGVGGIHDVDSAWDKITHGASLIQLYTGWVYNGPGFIKTLHTGLSQKLKDHGYDTIGQAVGSAIK